jgi:hypothetical protein
MKKTFLFALSLVTSLFTWAQTSPYTGNEVAAGDFFLYNVESGLWLQNNDGRNTGDWNTRGAVGTYGFEFGFSEIEGGWQLDPKFGHNHSMNSSNFYLDTGDGVTAWTLEPKTVEGVSNAYTIKAGDQVLGLDENENIALGTDNKSTWQLVTRAERVAYLKANGSVENPVDATFLIMDPGFANENERANAWIWERDGGNVDSPRWYWCRRSYAIWNSNSFKISQVISEIPNGTYKLTVKGYYRDGSANDVMARRADGTERILGKYFINTDKAPFKSIIDGGSPTVIDGLFWAGNDELGYCPDNADAFNRIFQDYPENYLNEGVVSVVTAKSMTIGIEKLEKNPSDWLAWDDFRLTYMGSNIDIAAMQEALQKAIDNAKAWNTANTTAALATALDAAISGAEGMLTSEDEDELSAATAAVSDALAAAQAVNAATLKAYIELAQKYQVDVEAANTVLAEATAQDAINTALLKLQAAVKVGILGGAADIYTGVAPAAGDFYLFNIGTGMWLNQGSDWCTHAAVDQAGLLVTFEENGDGFIFRTPWGSFNNSPYTDTPANTVYTFQAVEGKEGVYNILESGRLLGWNPLGHTDGEKYWASISNTEGADPADPNFQWKVVSKADRDALLAAAKKDAPVDATYLINNPSLQRQPGYDMWDKEVNGGNGGARVDNKGGDRSPNFAWEYWNCDNFKFSQKIEGLTPGLYEVSVQGVWREGDGGNQARIVNEGGTLNQKAYLLANDEKALLPNIASCPDFVPGVATQASDKGNFPNWPAEVIEFFEYGAYKTSVKAFVGEDGVLTIGVAVDEKAEWGDWIVFDNFRLTYLGNNDDVNYDRAVNAIKDGQTYRLFTEQEGVKYYLDAAGKLVDTTKKAATFTFNAVKVTGTLYETGWNLGSKFTNPSLTNGSSGDVVQNGGINVGSNDRNDWERQVFFLNTEGKYAIRATNANSENWGANTYWDFVEFQELPAAGYSLNPSYVWEIEENVDNRPAAFAKTQEWGAKLQYIEGLVTDGNQYTSNAKDPSEGSYQALVDGDYTTFFHSTWHTSNDPQADHYLQAELPEAAQDFYFYFKKRSQNNNNRPTTIVVSGSNDGETFTDITTIAEGLPTGATPIDYMSAKVAAPEAYKYLRFAVPTTNNGAKTGDHVFFTFSEFYILPSNELTDAAAPLMVGDYTDLEDADIETINTLDEQINAAVTKLELAADLADLNAIADKLQAQVDATDTYTAEEGVAAAATTAISNIKDATYTTKDEINAAKADIVAAAKEFFGAITAKKSIDITDWFIVNPYPLTKDGWEGTNFGTASDGVCEYWNVSAGTFHQIINLPAGNYKLTAIALQRTDMEGIIYAGDNSVVIAQATTDEANNRGQAAAWFAAGNGVNEVEFTTEGGEIEIGLLADANNGDHWTVWQNFTLTMVGDEAPVVEPLELTLDVERYPGMGYSVTEASVDFTEAIAFLGVEELTDDMLTVVNPDGTEVASTSTDGWFNAEGVATTWGDNTAINVKFFQAIPDGAYTICDMNGADEVGKTYTTKWALTANGKKVIYTINVTFVEKLAPVIANLSEVNVADTKAVDLTSELGKCYEALTGNVDIAAILTTLGVESINDLAIFAVASDGTLDDNYKLGTTDGWRNADGDWQSWGENAFFYVKVDFTRESAQIYEAGGMDGKNTTDEWENPASYKARYVFVNMASENLDAVVLEVTLTYIVPTGISSIGADLNNATIFDLNGRKISKIQKGGIYIVNGKKVTIK